MTSARAIDIVTKWLERVANRDPILFRKLLSQIKRSGGNVSKIEEMEKEKLNV
jgi:hypothetical protein